MRLIVIGGVAAGMSAASQAKRRQKDLEVVVLERGRDVSYGACGMPYNLADAGRDPEDLAVVSAREFREKRGLDLRLEHEAMEIDRANKTVRGRGPEGEFELAYDVLALATGSRAVRPPVPGMDSPGVFTLRTLEDLRLVRGRVARGPARDALILGGSYLGLELAEALTARGLKVTIVKRSERLLGFLPPELDELLRQELTKNGVEVIHSLPITRIIPGERLRMEAGDRVLEGDFIMAAAGFAPCSEFALAAGLEAGPKNSIATDRYGRTSDPAIFAAGDCGDQFHALTGKRVWVPLALHANRTGRIVGANATGASEEKPGVLGTSAVRVFGLQAAGTGLTADEARAAGFEPVSQTISERTRAHAFPGAKRIHVHLVADAPTGRLLGAALVGEEMAALRVNAAAVAITAGMTVERFTGLDLMYSPPFSPAWDPLLVCANQLVKKTGPGAGPGSGPA